MQHTLDPLDWQILEQLQDDARLSYSEIARRVSASQPTVAERIRRMQDEGIIGGYHAHVNAAALGCPITAFIRLKIAFPTRRERDIQQLLCDSLDEIQECHRITGEDCLLFKAHLRSVQHLEQLLQQLAQYGDPHTSIVLSTTLERRTMRAQAVR